MASPATDSAPVIVEAPGGQWHLFRHADITVATVEFRFSGSARVAYRQQATFSALEQQLGFAIPEVIMSALLDAAPTAPREPQYLAPGFPIEAHTPTRASRVTIEGQQPTTYGRLLHAEPPLRHWEHGPFRIEILAAGIPSSPGEHGGSHVYYRLWHEGQIVFAGARLPLTAADPLSDDALREIAVHPALTGQTTDTLTARQRDFLADAHAELTSALALPPPLFPPGTRVRVSDMSSSLTARGTILGIVFNRDGVAHYSWRPDIYDLPGHPRQQRRPLRSLVSPLHHAAPSLEPADTGVDGPDGLIALTYGARIRAIDHPHVDTGTVLRLRLDGAKPMYDIRPDLPGNLTVHLPADDVIALAGTAWPTIDAVLEARDQDHVPLVAGEAIVTLREMTIVVADAAGIHTLQPMNIPSLDQIFDPDSPDLSPAPSLNPRSSADGTVHRPLLTVGVDTVQVIDAHHGALDVPNRAVAAALAYPPASLARMAANLPGVQLNGTEVALTVAALVAHHHPDLPDPQTPTPHPDPPPPDPPGPAMDLDL